MRCVVTHLSLAALMISLACSEPAVAEPAEEQRTELLDQMRSLAEQTKIEFAGSERQPELLKNPVFRYDDQPRRFIDATMWVWTDEGRPVAFQKIEAVEYGERTSPTLLWQFCFASTAPSRLAAQWPGQPRFGSTEPGLVFSPLSGAPEVAAGNLQRKRQARDLARKFQGRILTDPRDNVAQQMRLLTTPIFEYADPQTKEFRGAVFGLASNGTNPDALIVLEVRGEETTPAWHLAMARMTCCGVAVTFGDEKVWQVDWVNGTDGPFPTWTFFSSVRQPHAKEDAP